MSNTYVHMYTWKHTCIISSQIIVFVVYMMLLFCLCEAFCGTVSKHLAFVWHNFLTFNFCGRVNIIFSARLSARVRKAKQTELKWTLHHHAKQDKSVFLPRWKCGQSTCYNPSLSPCLRTGVESIVMTTDMRFPSTHFLCHGNTQSSF